MADPVTVGLTLDTLFGDASPTGILSLSSWIYGSDLWGWILYALMITMFVFIPARGGWMAVTDPTHAGKRISDEIPRVLILFLAIIVAIAPLISAGAMKWVGIKSSQSIPTIQVITLGAANVSSAGADLIAQKEVSLNPVTAPSMPLLRRQADGYFTDAETAVKMAKSNVAATGGAMSGADLNANLLHGAGVAYASAGLNNANTPPEKLQKMMLADLDGARRMQYMWAKRPNAAMTECLGTTMLSDIAMALNNSQFATAPDDNALTASAWNTYYQAAAAYLVGGGNAGGGRAQNFGSAWNNSDAAGEAGTDVQLPPAADILKNSGPREIVINAEAYRGAFSPGVDPQELQQSGASVSARLAGAGDAQQRANLQRLLSAVNARDAAQAADQQLRNKTTAAFEALNSGFAMANVQGADSSNDFSAVLKTVQGDGASTLNELVQNLGLVNRCQAYAARVNAVNLGVHVSDLGTRFDLLRDQISDPTDAAKLVGTGGWLKLGIYYLSTASSYKIAYDNVNNLREAAKSETGTYFAGDPVAIQATNAGNVALGLGAGMMVGGAALQVAGSVAGNTIAGPGKAVGGLGEAAGKTIFDWGKFLVMASIFRDFAPYIVFVIVVFWWYLRLAALVLLAPPIVLIQGLRNMIALRLTLDDLADMAKRIGIFVCMPIVYVIAWEVIFFGTELIDVLIAATNGKTGVGATAGNLITLNVEQASMSSNVVPVVVKFVLGLIIATVFFKIESWLESFLVGHGTHAADMTAPSAKDLAK